jgi:hypothetical protein
MGDLQEGEWGTHLVPGRKPEKPRLPRPVVISRPNYQASQGPVLQVPSVWVRRESQASGCPPTISIAACRDWAQESRFSRCFLDSTFASESPSSMSRCLGSFSSHGIGGLASWRAAVAFDVRAMAAFLDHDAGLSTHGFFSSTWSTTPEALWPVNPRT